MVTLKPETFEPETLLEQLLRLESERGRERSIRWGARTLDLDLLAFGEEVRTSDFLTLPHPRMMERAFVLAPLCEVAPDWQYPIARERACDVLARLPNEGVTRTDLTWT